MNSFTDNCSVPSTVPVPPIFQSDILTPYMEHTTYLKKSQIILPNNEQSDEKQSYLIKALGEFSIPGSCYIDDTGHFNSVEFNICFNQISYVMFAFAFKHNIFNPILKDWKKKGLSYESFRKNQLSSMLIVKIEGKFLSNLGSDQFWGEVSLKKILFRSDVIYFYTDIIYYDKHNGKSNGSVVLAYNPNLNKRTT